VKYPEFCWK